MRQSKYTREVLAEVVAASVSIAGVLRHLQIPFSGGMHAHISRRIKHFEIDTGHFLGRGHRRGQTSSKRLSADLILVVRPAGSGRVKPHMLRRALIESGIPYCCAVCGLGGEWQGRTLVLHVDHIDGDYLNSRPDNLRFLCPNCHTQTASWAGKNKNLREYRTEPEIGRPLEVAAVLTLFEPESEAEAS